MSNEFREYIIKERVGGQGYGDCYAALKKTDSIKKVYILKTLIGNKITGDNIKALQNEIKILEELNKELNSKYIPVLYDADRYNYPTKENIEKNNENIINLESIKEKKAQPYYVIDYFSRGNLYMYVTKFKDLREKNILQEKHIKLIFKKILKGVQYCHNKNICHLDLKPANIVFDKKFEPTIIDYGFSDIFNGLEIKKGSPGTDDYRCPEMIEKNEFNGFQADVFSLGAILFNLETGLAGFATSHKNDSFYKHIINKNIGYYWNIFKDLNFELSDEFKELYLKMVSPNPLNRPKINQILESEWMQKINNLNEKEKESLEMEVFNLLNSLYNLLQKENEIIIAKGYESKQFDMRSISTKMIFSNYNDLKPTKISNDTIMFNNYIIMKGYLEPIDFMNYLVDEVCVSFKKNNPFFEFSQKSLRFRVTFEIENDDEDEEIIVQIELFKYEDERYLLEFIKLEGEFSRYYNLFLEIKKIICEKILKN